VAPEDTIGEVLFTLGNGQWDIAPLRQLLHDRLPLEAQLYDCDVEHVFPGIGRKVMLLNARLVSPGPNVARLILLAIRGLAGSGQHAAIPEFVEALDSGCDVVAGSRLRGRIEDGALTSLNRLGNQALSGLAAFLFGFPISDVCTGMWAFREDCLQRFRLAAESFDLEADIFASACEVGARLRELPVDYACRIGEAKLIPLRTGLLIAWRLLMKRLNARDLVGPEHRNVPAQAGRAVDQ